MDQKNELKTSLQGLIIISRLYGILSIRFEEKYIISVSKFGVVHNVLQNILIIYMTGHLYFKVHAIPISWITKTTVLGIPICLLITSVSFTCKVKSFIFAVNKIFRYSFFIRQKSFFRKIFWLSIGIISFIHLTFTIFFIWSGFQFSIAASFTSILWNCLLNSIAIVNVWFLVLMAILRKIFEEINKDISEIEKPYDYPLSFENRNSFVTNKKDNTLHCLIRTYFDVAECCTVMNKCFGPSAVAYTAYTVLYTTYIIYTLTEEAYHYNQWIVIGYLMIGQIATLYFSELITEEVRFLLSAKHGNMNSGFWFRVS